MKVLKPILVWVVTILVLASCKPSNSIPSTEISSTSVSDETSVSQTTSLEENKNHEEFESLYWKYSEGYGEELSDISAVLSTKRSPENENIEISTESKDYIYEGLPATIQKIFNVNDGTIYQYSIAIAYETTYTKQKKSVCQVKKIETMLHRMMVSFWENI